MGQLPQRTDTHVIDSRACGLVSTMFPAKTWVVRDLTERDFGIDKIVERFENGSATSELLLLQIKGTETEIDPANPRFSMQTKTLLYAELFSVPFLLVYCCVNDPDRCYYLWLQEYIRVRLNYENKEWRNQQTNTVYFPSENRLGTEKAWRHLTYISQFPKYQASWVSYYLALRDLCSGFPHVLEYDIMEKPEVDAIVSTTVLKLERAIKKVGYIPKRFIPDNFDRMIKLGNNILSSSKMPDDKMFFRYIEGCQTIQNSANLIALRFDEAYLRFLYESDGTADF